MKFFNVSIPAGVLGVVFMFCGCVSEQIDLENYGKVKFKRPEKIVYKQISSRDCELTVPTELFLASGKPSTVNVQLIYNGKKELYIQEWYMRDQYNFSVFYRRIPSDKPMAPGTAFTEFTEVIPLKPLPRHAELRLTPGNRAMLSVELPFTAKLAAGEEAVYEVYITTALKTFKIKSKRFMVYCR